MKRYLLGGLAALLAIILVAISLIRNSRHATNAVTPKPQMESHSSTPAIHHAVEPAATESETPALTKPWLEKLSRLQSMTEVFGQYGESNFKEMTDFLETIPDAELPEAVSHVQELQARNPTAAGHELLLRLLQRWSENDVHSTGVWIAHMPAGNERQEAASALAHTWARQNFADAVAWMQQLPDNSEKQSVQESLAAESAVTNPMESLKLACALPSSPARDEIITRAAGAWTASTPQDAAAWAKRILDETLRQQVISGIAITWSESDPSAARDLATNSLPSGPVQDRTIVGIVQRWMMTDAPAATKWVNQFPEGPLREEALNVLAEYARRN